ncbi:hypothetical protein F4801DRAFT_570276 [Xylaria longipes]|nr:hypothetical protein F4801DRAFT_570276 [Xylaria longipes]
MTYFTDLADSNTSSAQQQPLTGWARRLGPGPCSPQQQYSHSSPPQTSMYPPIGSQPTLKINQGSSTFENSLTVRGRSELDEGNRIVNATHGEYEQAGSQFRDKGTVDEESKVRQGNNVNGREIQGSQR